MLKKIRKKLNFQIKRSIGLKHEPLIEAYRGYGNKNYITIKGHVIEKSGVEAPDKSHTYLQNMGAMLKRYICDEIPFQNVKATFGNKELKTKTDETGHFEFNFELNDDFTFPSGQIWYPVYFELDKPLNTRKEANKAKGEVMIPEIDKCEFGVISDIDDTVLVSHANNAFKKLRLMLIKNAHTRHPFKGVAAFYNALYYGSDKKKQNPIFYVSSSEWNLYDLLIDFCDHQNIPKGPLLLKELKKGIKEFWKKKSTYHNHKINKIRNILKTYQNKKFILIGDSGQKDPRIYTQVVREFPNQILTVYIREMHKKRHEREMNMLLNEMARNGVEMLLMQDTEKAGIHAAKSGWIHNDFLVDIKSDIYRDESAPGELEAILQ